MQKFIMMMGLPGCGKSTKVKELVDDDTIVLSSDAIRVELGIAPDKVGRTFEVLHQRVRTSLKDGKSVIYDATNLSRKNRLAALRVAAQSHVDCRKILYCFLTPLGTCKKRNAQRTGAARVPDELYIRMMKQFDIPLKEEGWDEIEFMREPVDKLTVALGDTVGFQQDNIHHTSDLFTHMREAADKAVEIATDRGYGYWTRTTRLLETAGLYHDIGKLLTKDFHNARGVVTKDAYYYGHDKVGSYLYASELGTMVGYQWSDIYIISVLIGFHMRSYLVFDKQPDGKATLQDKEMLGTKLWEMLEILHEADKQAH